MRDLQFGDKEGVDCLPTVTIFEQLALMRGVVAKQDENVVEKEVDDAFSTAATTATILIDEVTLAQALVELKHTKPKAKAKGIVFHEPEESTTTTTSTIPKLESQDKGKAIMIEEHVKLKKKYQIILDEEVALKLQVKLQAKFDKEEQRLIDVDYLFAQRLQAKEQQELTDVEKATLFMQFLDKRRKFFAAKKAKEKRNKPPTRVNTFVDYNTQLVEESSKKAKAEVMEESSKRACTELEQESFKKQKINDDKDTAELK
uniref:Uncharacterized protein n=1 Tax=Tanacetum cinerariifolium TaxID=118510 RepID=A0A6L2NC91_TANCI|nr:hypothetical protein [Tanacetum cinerariifolium]